MTSTLPLQGVRVIELGSLIAGPYAGSVLAQFGADVIKVEPPEVGDPLRKWRKLYKGTSLWWYSQSRNKKSVTLDLTKPRAQQLARNLISTADVLIENFKPGTLEKWGLGWETLSQLNPRLIMVRVSGYGQTGPYNQRPGFAAIAESMGGLRYVVGYPDRPPVRVGVSIGDTLAGLYSVIGALIAMRHRDSNHGNGQCVDVALYEAVFGVMESLVPEYSACGFTRERSGASLPGIVPSNTYPCKDGHFVIIAGNSDSIYRRLMRAVNRPDLADDPRLEHNDGRAQHTTMIDAAIQAWTSIHELDHVLDLLENAGVPSGRIYTAADILNDPHYRERGMLEMHALPDGTPVEFPGTVPKLSETPGGTRSLGPGLGEHTDEILKSIGVTDAALADLRAAGVI